MIVAIRIVGKVGLKNDIVQGLDRLRLRKKYSCVIVREDDSTIGMIKQLENFIAYGKLDKETLKELLMKRGRMPGDKAIKKDIDKIADEIMAGKSMKELGLKPFFRLHPARGGMDSSKHHYPKGVLGDNKEDIAKLVRSML